MSSVGGALEGDITVSAGGHFHLHSSDLLAEAGDITIDAGSIAITAGENTYSYNSTTVDKSTGLTVSVGGMLGLIAQSAALTKSAVRSQDSRAASLFAIATARSFYDSYKGGKQVYDNVKNLYQAGGLFGNGGVLSKQGLFDTSSTSGLIGGVSVSFGSSKTTTKTSLEERIWDNALIQAGGRVSITSDGNTLIRGGQVIGDAIIANIGGDLSIISLQDSASETYDQKSSSWSLGASFSAAGLVGVDGSYGKSGINAEQHWKSVVAQSGLFAGTSYDVTVGGDLNMVAGVIGSESTGDNSLSVAGETILASLENSFSQKIKTSSSGFSVGFSMDPGKLVENLKSTLFTNAIGGLGSILGSGTRSESESGTTDSVITGTAVGLRPEHQINNGIISVGGAVTGAITRPGESLADSVAREAELNAALAAASAATSATLGDLGLTFGMSDELKSILHGATQAGLAAIAGGDALAAGTAGAATSFIFKSINEQLGTIESTGDKDKDEAAYKRRLAQLELFTTAAGALIGSVFGDALTGANISNSVAVNNDMLHISRCVVLVGLCVGQHRATIIERDSPEDFSDEEKGTYGGDPIKLASGKWGYILEHLRDKDGNSVSVINGRTHTAVDARSLDNTKESLEKGTYTLLRKDPLNKDNEAGLLHLYSYSIDNKYKRPYPSYFMSVLCSVTACSSNNFWNSNTAADYMLLLRNIKLPPLADGENYPGAHNFRSGRPIKEP